MSSTSSATKPRITIPFVSQRVEDLLLWRNPTKSGAVFGGGTLVFLFFFFLKMPFISLVLYTAGTLMLVSTLWARFGRSVGRPMPELPPYLREGMSEADYRLYCDKAKPRVDYSLGVISGLITCRNMSLNIKIIAALFVAGKVLAYMSPISIAYLVMFLAFVGPKVYEEYKEHIDNGLEQARVQGMRGYDTACGEINRAVERVPALQNLRDNVRQRMGTATKKTE